MSLAEWREARRERSRARMVARLKFPERDVREDELLRLNILKEWGVIDEEDYEKGIQSLANRGAPVGRAWDLRAEVRAHDRRSRRRQR